MSEKVNIVRALVCERLSAAAEDICALFERTIAEYEEELSRSKEENERKQKLLDSVLSPRVQHRRDAQVQTQDEETPEDPAQIPSVKKEFGETVKNESENGEDEETDNDDDWDSAGGSARPSDEPPLALLHLQGSSPDQAPAGSLEPCVREQENGTGKTYKCDFCEKSFGYKHTLKRHVAAHSQGPAALRRAAAPGAFRCPVCLKSFTRTFTLQSHMITHTGEKPFCCPLCSARFNRKSNLNRHFKVHAQK